MTSPTISQVIMSGNSADLSDDHIRQFKEHPELLELIGDRETLSLRNLWRTLWIAVALVAVSKIISVKYGDAFDQFIFSVASDLVFEMGAALIGSVATVIFIQYQQKRQFEENMAFRSEIQRRIDMMDVDGDKGEK